MQLDGVQEDLLKKLGEEHPQYEFMKSLATKCGYFFFSREHVHAITREVIVYRDSENDKDLVEPSLQLLVVSSALFMSVCYVAMEPSVTGVGVRAAEGPA